MQINLHQSNACCPNLIFPVQRVGLPERFPDPKVDSPKIQFLEILELGKLGSLIGDLQTLT